MLRRAASQLRLGNRRPAAATGTPGPAAPGSLFRRLSHVLVVITNVLQLLLMLSFLVLLLLQLNKTVSMSWYVIFSPLWASDTITLFTGTQELYRLFVSTEGR